MMTASHVKYYSATGPRILIDDNGRVINDPTAIDAGSEFVKLVNAYNHQHPSMPWATALAVVKASAEGQLLLREYGKAAPSARRKTTKTVAAADVGRPDLEVDRKARDHRHEHGSKSYAQAVRDTLKADPDLRARYAAYYSMGER